MPMKDTAVQKLIELEKQRQVESLELIPSENYVSSDVRAALASEFTNKYSEGYPGHRYYGGQEHTDALEELAIERAKKLFKADHANVQPHSGAQANAAVYHAWADPGDTILAMDLSHGGHLTHGHPVTVLAHQFNFVRYGMKDVHTGEIDFEAVRLLAKTHRPKIIVVGHSSFPRLLDYKKFAEIGNEVGSLLMADMAHLAGLIAGGVMENPLECGFHVMTCTTHKTLRGPRGGMILSKGIVSNPLKAPEKSLQYMPTLIDRTVFPGLQGGPHMNVIAAKAVAIHEASTKEFAHYAAAILVNAQTLAYELQKQGVVLVTGGTDNHLLLLDVASTFGIDGNVAETLLGKAGLHVNKNVIPDDQKPAFRPSGIRLGTPAATTRGMGEAEMKIIAENIVRVLKNKDDATVRIAREKIAKLCADFPLPT